MSSTKDKDMTNQASPETNKLTDNLPKIKTDDDDIEDLPLPKQTFLVDSKSGTNEQIDNIDVPDLPTPPDGGWGWVIVFSSFMVHIIADGVAYSFGVFYVEFLEYFQGGRGETGWVGSLVVGITLSSGPLASALTNKYGCRPVTIAGSVMAAAGFVISIFAPNITYLYFSFGILGGLGLGLIYLPAIVSVTYYFEKRRAFATGLAVCGSGIGTFIFAPVSKMLVDEYGWKGACLILAGLLLNCCVCGALFRPLESRKHKSKISGNTETINGAIELKNLEKTAHKQPNGSTMQPLLSVENAISRSHGHLHEVERLADMENLRKHKSEIILNDIEVKPSRPKVERRISTSSHSSQHGNMMYRKDILYSASLQNIDAYRSNPRLYSKSVTSIPQLHELAEDQTKDKCRWFHCSRQMIDAFKQMTDFSLLKDPIFLMFAISNLFTSIGFNVPYIYLPDRALLAGLDKSQGAFLLSVIGISNTIGRVIFGWISDRPVISQYRLYVYNTALTLCGICTVLSTLADTYPLLICYAASFGLFIGTYVTLTSVILVDLLGLDRLTSSFGLLLIFQGVATIIGPPIAGWVYDGTGSYNASFYITGVMIGLSGFMLYFIPCLRILVKKCSKPIPSTSIEMEVTHA